MLLYSDKSDNKGIKQMKKIDFIDIKTENRCALYL